MRQVEIEYFSRNRLLYHERIENYKLANLGKVMKNRIMDFSHTFYVKYADSTGDKIDFCIKLMIKYQNDEFEEKTLEMDLTINQFYILFNDFQKIDTLVKTLI